MATQYRLLEPHEIIQKGDEWAYRLDAVPDWGPSSRIGKKAEHPHCIYRRQLSGAWYPSHKCNQVPQVPVHVAWAESPASMVLTDRDAVAAKPEASIEVGDGYVLVKRDDYIQTGDEWYEGNGRWKPTVFTTSQRYKYNIDTPLRRKLPVAPTSVPAAPGEGYRWVEVGEYIETGDEWREDNRRKITSFKTKDRIRKSGGKLRRKLSTPHIVTIDDPMPVNVGEGYRLLGDDEKWKKGDEFIYQRLLPGGKWYEMCVFNWGQSTRIWNDKPENKGEMWKIVARRKVTDKAPVYRPYADAAEAAKALEGKLIRHKVTTTHLAVSMVTRDKVVVGEDDVSFEGLRAYWKFTDGTPCGVLVTENEGK